MPTTYAHDLFGKKVYRQLPDEMKKLIRENGELYRIGLHGPDILFYYFATVNRITQFGVKMHEEKACIFFEQGMERVRETKDRALLAYLLGFGCHYLLDSSCHPYVNETDKKGIISHTLLEKEFDRTLMELTGKDPLHYYPSDCIVPGRASAATIHKVLPLISSRVIHMSLCMMKFITNLMVYGDTGRKSRIIGAIARLGGKKHHKFISENFMTREPVSHSRMPVEVLLSLFDQAAEEAPAELEELYALAKEEKPLSDRWSRTYNG